MTTTVVTPKTALHKMLEQSQEFDLGKHDHTVPVNAIHFDNDARMVLPNDVALFENAATPPLEPTDRAWDQMCSKLGYTVFGKGTMKKLPVDYLLNIDPELTAINMNRHINKANGENWFVRGYLDHARAVMSERYAAISNTELLDLLVQVVDKQATPDFKMVRPYIDPDTLHAKMIWRETDRPDGGGGNYGVGVYVRNGEIGNLSVAVYPMIQRHSCTNSIILKEDQGVKFRHVGDVTGKRVQIQSVMLEIFPQAFELLEKMIAAQEEEIPNFVDVLNGLAKKHGWDDNTRLTVATGTEGSETRGGLVNGISYAAHKINAENADEMSEMEQLAGSILVAPGSLFHKMATVAKFA